LLPPGRPALVAAGCAGGFPAALPAVREAGYLDLSDRRTCV